MTWVSSFSHLKSIFQWKKTSRTHRQPFLGTILLPCISQPSETHLILSYPRGKELAHIDPLTQCPTQVPEGSVVSMWSLRSTRTKVPPRRTPRHSTKFRREKGAPHRPGDSMELSTGLFISLVIVQTPGKQNSNSKEKEIAGKNLSTFKGLGDQ